MIGRRPDPRSRRRSGTRGRKKTEEGDGLEDVQGKMMSGGNVFYIGRPVIDMICKGTIYHKAERGPAGSSAARGASRRREPIRRRPGTRPSRRARRTTAKTSVAKIPGRTISDTDYDMGVARGGDRPVARPSGPSPRPSGYRYRRPPSGTSRRALDPREAGRRSNRTVPVCVFRRCSSAAALGFVVSEVIQARTRSRPVMSPRGRGSRSRARSRGSRARAVEALRR